MKITFTVTDLGDVRTLSNAFRYKSALWALRESLIADEAQSVLDTLNGILDEYGLTLEEDYEPTEESGCACGRAPPTDGDGGDGGGDAMAAGVGRR